MNILINSGRTVPFLGTREKLITEIIDQGHNVILTGYQTGYEEEIKKMGATFVEMPVNRAGLNPIGDLKLLMSYYRLIKKEKIEIVHSYTIKPNIYGSIAAKLAGVKEVYPTLNGIGYAFTGEGLKAKLVRIIASFLYWLTFRCSKKVFFHNIDDINEIVNRKLISEEKCVVINGSGIDMNYYKKKEIPESISFVLISRLLKAKGILEYAEAAKKVKEKYKEVNFGLIGPADPNPTGIKLQDIQNYIDEGIINYYGEQSDVRPFLEEAAVLVLPSYREGVPHTILEAMSTGRAILSTDVPGCRETVVQGVNGFLVPVKDAESLAEKMIWMIENKKAVKQMGEESFKIARDKFEVSKVNRVMLDTMGL